MDTLNEYIYRTKDGKLLLPSIIYGVYRNFSFTKNNNPDDFAVYAITKIAGSAESMNIDNSMMSYYSALFKLIKNENGICEPFSNYTGNQENKEYIKKLVKSGNIIQYKCEVNSDGELVIIDTNDNIGAFCIIRNKNGKIILPNDIYNIYYYLDNNDPFYFAKKVLKITSDNIPNELVDSFNYFAAIYSLIEKDRSCVNISDYLQENEDSNQSTTNIVNKLISSQDAALSEIKISKEGVIREQVTNNVNLIKKSIYYQYQKNRNEEFYNSLENEFSKIEDEMQNLVDNITISSNSDYQKLLESAKQIKTEAYAVYKRHCQLAGAYKNLLNKVEAKYNKTINKIDKSIKIINCEYNKFKSKPEEKPEKENIDYTKNIISLLDETEEEINNISKNMIVKYENDYILYDTKLIALKNKLDDIENVQLKEAYENEALTASILKETLKRLSTMTEQIDTLRKKMEELKSKILTQNIFGA